MIDIDDINVWVVDDNLPMCQIGKLVVNRQIPFAHVSIFEDGIDAWEHMTQHHEIPDLIILDVRMPVMDGFEFCRKVEASDMKKPRIVIHSSLPLSELQTFKQYSFVADTIEKCGLPKSNLLNYLNP